MELVGKRLHGPILDVVVHTRRCRSVLAAIG
jgi:hypothetical protein